jgi:GNAT superfamily N-acetyltransferase
MITLRDATENDKSFLWGLKVSSMRKYIESIYGWDEAVQYSYFEKGFQPEALQIIQVDGRDVGMYEAQVREDDWLLVRIEVHPDYQGKGIGTIAINGIIEKANEAGRTLCLQVFKINPAQNLYQRLGFTKTGETKTHILMEMPNKSLNTDVATPRRLA